MYLFKAPAQDETKGIGQGEPESGTIRRREYWQQPGVGDPGLGR